LKILIFGLPGSGKTTLAKPFADLIGGVHINADKVREKYVDWDFTPHGRKRQALRMRHIADGVELAGKVAVADFVCPTDETRMIFQADFSVWMDTIKESKYKDTNEKFIRPYAAYVDYHVSEWFNDTDVQLLQVVKRWMGTNQNV